jgi:hypothetical protein
MRAAVRWRARLTLAALHHPLRDFHHPDEENNVHIFVRAGFRRSATWRKAPQRQMFAVVGSAGLHARQSTKTLPCEQSRPRRSAELGGWKRGAEAPRKRAGRLKGVFSRHNLWLSAPVPVGDEDGSPRRGFLPQSGWDERRWVPGRPQCSPGGAAQPCSHSLPARRRFDRSSILRLTNVIHYVNIAWVDFARWGIAYAMRPAVRGAHSAAVPAASGSL